jgi:hypothetical protein
MAINCQVPKTAGNFSSSWRTICEPEHKYTVLEIAIVMSLLEQKYPFDLHPLMINQENV